ncbi:hypothetical protein ACHAXA_002134 [Cyclostephanos tholiformis]|uniref:Thioredoxin domain-containing protein n=1 Tax=Cyclostephanos tholiformis TaxID=382380 RepID=A0ABD3RQX3_9STRA
MTSNQNPNRNAKAAKFVASNPLAPLADPFRGMADDENELHREVSEGVQRRLEEAMDTLREKHRTGTNDLDDVDRAPTGAAYRAIREEQARMARMARETNERSEAIGREEEVERISREREIMRRMKFGNDRDDGDGNRDSDGDDDDDDDDDDEFDHLLDEDDDDAELQALRDARIEELKREHNQRAMHVSLGHGSLRTITQDEFLPECTGSSRFVVVHYYHDDFERCKIMDYHLKLIAEEHVEAKFLRIDASKSPFFVSRLKIQTLPSLFVFDQGREIGRLTGFEGLALNSKKPDEWHTGRLQEWISSTGAIRYERPSREVEEERKRLGIVVRGGVYSDDRRDVGMIEEYY